MEAKDILTEWRVWMLITALIGAFIAIGPHYTSIPSDTSDGNRTTVATNINKGLELAGGARVLIQPQFGDQTPSEKSETVDQIITTLKTRVQAFGLQDMTIRSVDSLTGDNSFIQVEMAGASTEQLQELISRQGRFRASMGFQVAGNRTFSFADANITMQRTEDSLLVNQEPLEVNETKTFNAGSYDIPVRHMNQSGGASTVHMTAFTGEDITGVDIDPSRSGVSGRGDSYQFQFQVSITQDAAEQFQELASNFDTGAPTQSGNLPGVQLVLSLDRNTVSSLGISTAFANQVITTPSINGGAETREQALQEMNEIQSVLQSGALPVPIDVVSTDRVSPTLGAQFMSTAITAILAAVVAVGILLFIRYQTPSIAFPIMITGFSEVIILLAAFSDGAYLFNSPGIATATIAALGIPTIIGVTVGLSKSEFSSLLLPLATLFIGGIMRFSTSLDLASIAGIIAAVGTGVDDQIIITDEQINSSSQAVISIAEKLKRAFFIIFTSAASTIGAMLPVMAIGAGAVRGFAITTILGVIIGITITRPAYARIIDKLGV